MLNQTVFVVDDDAGIRSSITLLLKADNIFSTCFSSATDFLLACGSDPQGCLILDVRMPGLSGLQLQDELVSRNIHLPIIFLTGFADTVTTVNAIRKGALDFLIKPINGKLLLQCVHTALGQHQLIYNTRIKRSDLTARMGKLTEREHEILALAISGASNKLMSNRLAISARTVEGHRARIFIKLNVSSLMDLSTQAAALDLTLPDLLSLR